MKYKITKVTTKNGLEYFKVYRRASLSGYILMFLNLLIVFPISLIRLRDKNYINHYLWDDVENFNCYEDAHYFIKKIEAEILKNRENIQQKVEDYKHFKF